MTDKQPDSNDLWFLETEGQSSGPYSTAYVVASIRSGLIDSTQKVRSSMTADWRPVESFPQFQESNTSTWFDTRDDVATSPLSHPSTALDRILPPKRVIELFTIFAMVVRPCVWFLGAIGTCGSGLTFPEGTKANEIEAVLLLATIFLGFIQAVIWFATGFLLNRYNRLGLWLSISLCVSSWIGLGVSLIAIIGLFAAFGFPPDNVTPPMKTIIDLFVLTISGIDLTLQTLGAVLLFRHRQKIPWNLSK